MTVDDQQQGGGANKGTTGRSTSPFPIYGKQQIVDDKRSSLSTTDKRFDSYDNDLMAHNVVALSTNRSNTGNIGESERSCILSSGRSSILSSGRSYILSSGRSHILNERKTFNSDRDTSLFGDFWSTNDRLHIIIMIIHNETAIAYNNRKINGSNCVHGDRWLLTYGILSSWGGKKP